MSAYAEVVCQIKEREDLLAALAEMGYAAVEVHEKPTQLHGYEGDLRDDVAHVVIRRKHVGEYSNDVGFLRGQDGTWKAVVSEFDSHEKNDRWAGHLDNKHGCQGGGFVAEVRARATAFAAVRTARQQGFPRVRRIQEGRTIRLVCEP